MCNARGSCRSRLDDSIRFFVIRSPCSRGYGPPENHPVSLGSLCMMLFGTKRFCTSSDCVPNRSIVVIQFNKAADATEFAAAYNGKPFNSMEVRILLLSRPISANLSVIQPEICHVVHVSSVIIDTEDSVSPSLGSAQGSIYELPTCPVCLERMDSAVTGLITVPCSHTFHCMCLSKWGDSRYALLLLLDSHHTNSA